MFCFYFLYFMFGISLNISKYQGITPNVTAPSVFSARCAVSKFSVTKLSLVHLSTVYSFTFLTRFKLLIMKNNSWRYLCQTVEIWFGESQLDLLHFFHLKCLKNKPEQMFITHLGGRGKHLCPPIKKSKFLQSLV